MLPPEHLFHHCKTFNQCDNTNTDDSLEVVYTGMDAGELEEVSSCDNLSDSDVRK